MYVLELMERVLMKSLKMMINRSVPLFWAIVGGLDYAPFWVKETRGEIDHGFHLSIGGDGIYDTYPLLVS